MCFVSRVSYIKFNENKKFYIWQNDRKASFKNVFSGICGIPQAKLKKFQLYLSNTNPTMHNKMIQSANTVFSS